MGYMKYTIGLVMAGLFTIAILGFAINFADDNNAPIDITDDSQITGLYTQTKDNLSSFREATGDAGVSIMNSTLSSGDDISISGGQFKITPISAIGVVTNIIKVGYVKIFGNDSGFGIFLTSLGSILAFTMFFFIMKAWFGRNPE